MAAVLDDDLDCRLKVVTCHSQRTDLCGFLAKLGRAGEFKPPQPTELTIGVH